MDSMLENQAGDGFSNKDRQPSSNLEDQPFESTISDARTVNVNGQLKSTPKLSRDIQSRDKMNINDKKVGFPSAFSSLKDNFVRARGQVTDTPFPFPIRHEERASYMPKVEGLTPGIEEFQIIGDAKPGNTLRACGYPVRGTSLCIFQWVHHLQDGTWQYIEGATNPDYVVTADDVDKLIAVECRPMDDNGHQGELVRLFANDQRKIACDPEMNFEIETYISAGRARFDTSLLIDEVWQQTRFILKRSTYQVKIKSTDVAVIEEKYSADLSIKIPSGLSTQFVLTCSDGTSHPFSTYNDVR
ncbi:hypothetical protein IFM89_030672 [Coptis chinensis]|uniref:Uncharacterized protein n=1 Tax=Coptis chinensis TaxID=261450 RepID=A0A835J0I2_9MAGN|nr:hypothetical protein IFM89_030672 [Coptis chinensis]